MLELPSSFYQAAPVISAAVCLLTGIAVIWTNPQRLANRAFLVSAILTATWLACVYGTMISGAALRAGKVSDLPFWLRLNNAVAAGFPFALTFVVHAIHTEDARVALRRSIPWFICGLILVWLCYTKTFIQPRSVQYPYDRGASYYLYSALCMFAYISATFQMLRSTKQAHGIRRVEAQFIGLTLGVMTTGMCCLSIAGTIFNLVELKRASMFLIPPGFLIAAWTLAYHSIFEGRNQLLALCQRVGFIFFMCAGIWLGSAVLPTSMQLPSKIILSTVATGCLALLLEHKLRSVFDLDEERKLQRARREIINAANEEAEFEQLTLRFRSILYEQCDSTHLKIHIPSHPRLNEIGETVLTILDRADSDWRQRGWISPENLMRLPTTSETSHAQEYFASNEVGLVVIVAGESHSASMIVVFGRKRRRWPYCYPEIQRLIKLTEMIDNVLTHTRLVSQAQLKTRIDHLALMSRELAHDLKNLVTPVSSFLIHVEKTLSLNEVEAEVHAAAKRSVQIMSDYIRESLWFADRMSPRLEWTRLEPILAVVRDVTAARANRRKVRVVFVSSDRSEFMADAVLLQRMLTNLVNNSIDASRPNSTVTISAGREQDAMRFTVADEGIGIPAENLERVFEPYFTTKQFGDEVRGFGLGLTIAQKIARLHGGAIELESKNGRGTQVTVDIPHEQSPAVLNGIAFASNLAATATPST